VDPADGEPYTRAEFEEQYGGTTEWDVAARSAPAVVAALLAASGDLACQMQDLPPAPLPVAVFFATPAPSWLGRCGAGCGVVGRSRPRGGAAEQSGADQGQTGPALARPAATARQCRCCSQCPRLAGTSVRSSGLRLSWRRLGGAEGAGGGLRGAEEGGGVSPPVRPRTLSVPPPRNLPDCAADFPTGCGESASTAGGGSATAGVGSWWWVTTPRNNSVLQVPRYFAVPSIPLRVAGCHRRAAGSGAAAGEHSTGGGRGGGAGGRG
jgi:hypothetical protein